MIIFKKSILTVMAMALLVGCGHKPRKCWEEYKYKYNGYQYVEYKYIKCEPLD